jgi:hypothetical protein
MPSYWVTIRLSSGNDEEARAFAEWLAKSVDGNVVQVDHEPPQGSLIVGDYSY